MLVAVNLTRKEDGTRAGVTVRGVEPSGAPCGRRFELVEGRMFQPGLREMIVGQRRARGVSRASRSATESALRDSEWTVVGVFDERRRRERVAAA